MQDGIIKGNGSSRYLKTVAEALTLYPTYEDFMAALIAGTLPIDLNGINTAGWDTVGTALNKANLLSDATAALYGLGTDATVNDALAVLKPGTVPAGSVFWLAAQTAPAGFLICDGSLVGRTDYAALFAAIGTAFGAGDGSTTFALPDLRAAFIRGAGTQSSYSASFGSMQDATYILDFQVPKSIRQSSGSSIASSAVSIGSVDRSAANISGSYFNCDNDSTIAGTNGTYSYMRPYNMALTPIIKY